MGVCVLGAKSLGRGLSLTRLVGHDDDDDDETVHIDLDCEWMDVAASAFAYSSEQIKQSEIK